MIEELGELSESDILPESERTEAKKDAVGDFAVFAMHYCALRNWNISTVIELAVPVDDRSAVIGWKKLLQYAGELAHSHLKGEQKIRGTWHQHELVAIYALARLTAEVRRYCLVHDFDFFVVVAEVWQTVKQRDWQKHQKDGVSE